MLKNLFKRKTTKEIENKDLEKGNKKRENKKFWVKDLYVARPGIITRNYDDNCYYYNEGNQNLETIVVKKQNEHYVKNVLNEREYGVFGSFETWELCKLENQYMVNGLYPLENYLTDKTKKIITEQEIIELLHPKTKQEDESSYRDIVVQEISKTLSKINDSNIKEEEKEKLRDMLLAIANYYENSLQINNPSLNIVDLRMECLKRLVEIEIKLPPENVNNSIGEIANLKEKILKK